MNFNSKNASEPQERSAETKTQVPKCSSKNGTASQEIASKIQQFGDEDITFEEKYNMFKAQFEALATEENLLLTEFEIVHDETGRPKSITFNLQSNASYLSPRRLSYPITLLRAAAESAFETSPLGRLQDGAIWSTLNQLATKKLPLEFEVPVAEFHAIENSEIREDFMKFFHDRLHENGYQLEFSENHEVFHFSKYETQAQMSPSSWTLSFAQQAINWITGHGGYVYEGIIFPVVDNALTDLLDIIDSPEFDFILHQAITNLIEDTI